MTALPVWPTSLPQEVALDGYAEIPQMPSVDFPTDGGGPPISRSLGTYRSTEMNVQMIMTTEQVDILADFVFKDLRRGNKQFQYPHPRRGEVVTVIIKGRPPYRVEPYSDTEYFRITMTLTVLGL
jgi:hypothetical protein